MPGTSAARRLATWTLLCAALALACGRREPAPRPRTAEVPIHVALGGAPIPTLVVEVTAADLGGGLVFNLAAVGGIASGTILVPAGPARTFTARAFDSTGEVTHEGSVTIDVVPGTNPPVSFPLVPRPGTVEVTTRFGAITVTVVPGSATLAPGETLQLTATLTDDLGRVLPYEVTWSAAPPSVATVDALGVVTARAPGAAAVYAAAAGVAGVASVIVATPQVYAISGQVSPPASGAGTSLALTGDASATTMAAADGTYAFAGLARGSYIVTPSRSGVSFAPASRAVTLTTSDVSGVDFAVLSGTPNLVVNASTTFQTMEGMGASVNVHGWNQGEMAPALDALAVDNGMSLFRVVRDRMDWVPSAADIPLLHARDAATLARIYEAPLMKDIWGTIAHLNTRGIGGRSICLNFMGWTAPWMGGSGRYNVASSVNAGMEDELATMIASLVYYGRVVKGLDFTLVSPLNEPDLNGLEGPLVDATQYATIAGLLATELDAMGLGDVRLVGPDTARSPSDYVGALQGNAAWARVDHLAWHSYSGPVSPGAAVPDKSWWMTETALWDGTLDSGGTPGVGEWAFARDTFRIMLQDVLNGFPAVLVWEGYDSWYYHHDAYSRWGLLSYDETTGTYARRKRFHVNGHLTRWIRPGQQRVAVTRTPANVLATAVVDPVSRTFSIVGHNADVSPRVLQGSLENLPFSVTTLRLHETDSGSKDQARGADVFVVGGRFSVAVGPDTVFSLSAGP